MNLIQARFKAFQSGWVLLETPDGQETILNRCEIDEPSVLDATSDAAVQAYFDRDPSILVLCSEGETPGAPLLAERQILLRDSRLKALLSCRLGQVRKLIIRDASSNVYAYGDFSEGVTGRCRKREIRRLVKERGLLPLKPSDDKHPLNLEMLKRKSTEDDEFWHDNYPEYELHPADTILGCICGFEWRGDGEDLVVVDLDLVAYLNLLAAKPDDVFKHLGFDSCPTLPVVLESDAHTRVQSDTNKAPPDGCGVILVVDDDNEGTLRPARDFLVNNGYDVITAQSANEAKGIVNKLLESADSKTITAAFVDIHLTPDIQHSNYTGIEFALWLEERISTCGIILMSAEGEMSTGGAKQQACGDLNVVAYQAKPFKHERFRDLIRAALLPPRVRAADLFVTALDQSSKTGERLHLLHEQAANATTSILEGLKKLLGADSVYMFKMHRITRIVDVEKNVGHPFPRFGQYRQGLRYSPVRDVCEGNEEWCHTDVMPRREGKHRKLLNLCDPDHKYHTCVACPVPAPPGNDFRYGLFAFFFHDTDETSDLARPAQLIPTCPPDVSSQVRVMLAQYAARETAHRLSRELMLTWHREMRAKEDSMFMAGMMAVSLGHELFHCLQGADWECATLIPRIKPNISITAKEVLFMERIQARANRAIEIATDLARQVRTDAEGIREFEIVDIIASAARTAMLACRGVSVRYFKEPRTKVKGQAGKFERVIHNLILNAVQQTARSMRLGGMVYVKHYVRGVGKNCDLVVRIFDNGLGIHGYMRERIFEPGETTRPDGTGMGLTICRQELDRMGHATVHVAESVLWAGTCFEVVFPPHLLTPTR